MKSAFAAAYLFAKNGTKAAGSLIVGSLLIHVILGITVLLGVGTFAGVRRLLRGRKNKTASQVAAVEATAPPVANEAVAAA